MGDKEDINEGIEEAEKSEKLGRSIAGAFVNVFTEPFVRAGLPSPKSEEAYVRRRGGERPGQVYKDLMREESSSSSGQSSSLGRGVAEGRSWDKEDRSYSTRECSSGGSSLRSSSGNWLAYPFILLACVAGIGFVGKAIEESKTTSTPLEKRVVSSEPLGHFKEDLALYRIEGSVVNRGRPRVEIPAEIKQGLIKLVKLKGIEKNGEIYLNDYTLFGENIWVAGKSFANKKHSYSTGFICYSPDYGNTWFEQLRLGPGSNRFELGGRSTAELYGIHFSDSREGWSFTLDSIFHTDNGGETWNRSYMCNFGILRELHIIDREILLAKRMDNRLPEDPSTWHQFYMEYTLNGGRTWQSCPEWKPELLGLGTKIKSAIKLETPY